MSQVHRYQTYRNIERRDVDGFVQFEVAQIFPESNYILFPPIGKYLTGNIAAPRQSSFKSLPENPTVALLKSLIIFCRLP